MEQAGSWVSPGCEGSHCLYLECVQGLRAWGYTFALSLLYPPSCVWALVRIYMGTRGFGVIPQSWLCPHPDVHGCVLQPEVSLSPSYRAQRHDSLIIVVSAKVLVSVSSECVCQCMHMQCLLPLCPEVGLGSKQALLPHVWTLLLTITASTLVRSSTWTRGARAGTWNRLALLGQHFQTSLSPRVFKICCLCSVRNSRQVCLHFLWVESQFLTTL